MSNKDLKKVFRDVHETIARDVNPDSVIDSLFSKAIISDDDYYDLRQVQGSRNRCRELMSLLFRSSHPETFIQLRQALVDNYPWIVEEIDQQLTPTADLLKLRISSAGRPQTIINRQTDTHTHTH